MKFSQKFGEMAAEFARLDKKGPFYTSRHLFSKTGDSAGHLGRNFWGLVIPVTERIELIKVIKMEILVLV